MDLPWGDKASRKFVTNLGLITSNGPHGYNIMTAEWTHHISYSPGLIAVNIRSHDATAENIRKTKVFGVNLASEDQNFVSSVAGGSSGKDVDKIKVLEELGVEFYKAKKIDVLLVKGTAMNAECKVKEIIELGDHVMFVGEVVEFSSSNNNPLVYTGGKYFKIGDDIKKPPQEVLNKFSALVKKYHK